MQREARSKEPKAALTPSAYSNQVPNPRRKPPPRSAIAARRFTPSSRTYSVHVLSTRLSPRASHRANARRATRLSAAWDIHDSHAPTLPRVCSRTCCRSEKSCWQLRLRARMWNATHLRKGKNTYTAFALHRNAAS